MGSEENFDHIMHCIFVFR